MQADNRFLDDFARVVNGAVGAFAGLRDEAEVWFRQQFETMLARMDLVTREEFDAVRTMAARARGEQEALAARVAALETALAEGQGRPAARRPAKKAKPRARRGKARRK